MTITSTSLARAAGLAAVAAGPIFIAVQINHPPMEVASVTTTEWVVRNSMKVVMAVLALAGITGMYLRQVRQAGLLGLIGYLLFASGYLVMMAIAFVAAYILPSLADTAPAYVNDVLTLAARWHASGDVGLFRPLSSSRASATSPAGSSSASPCSGPASSLDGRQPSSPSRPSTVSLQSCPTRSTASSPSRPASPSSASASPSGATSATRRACPA